MIFVTVGTHEDPFDRLVAAAERIAMLTGERVVVQAGPSRVATPHCERSDWCTPTQMTENIASARVVLLHGGPSTLREVLDAGVLPVVVPRDPERGEHVDGHQLRSATHLPAGVPVFKEIGPLLDWLIAGELPDPPALHRSSERTDEYCERLDAVLRDISAPPVSGRGRFRAILATLLRRFPHGL